MLGKVKKQLDTASKTLDQTDVRARAMERRLRQVEELPAEASTGVLALSDSGLDENVDDEV